MQNQHQQPAATQARCAWGSSKCVARKLDVPVDLRVKTDAFSHLRKDCGEFENTIYIHEYVPARA